MAQVCDKLAARFWILIPPFLGSNPSTPATFWLNQATTAWQNWHETLKVSGPFRAHGTEGES